MRNFEALKTDTKLTFDDLIKDMWRKADNKLCALGRITPYMGLGKKNITNEFLFCGTVSLLSP